MTGRNFGVPSLHALLALAALLICVPVTSAQSLLPSSGSNQNPLRPPTQNGAAGQRSSFTTQPPAPVAPANSAPSTATPLSPLSQRTQPAANSPATGNVAPAGATQAATPGTDAGRPTPIDKLTPGELENRKKQAEAANRSAGRDKEEGR